MVEVLANTDMIKKMLEHGIIPRLPKVSLSDDMRDSHPDFIDLEGEDNDVVSVEYVGDEEVQCIKIDDENHLYITDDYIPTHNTSNIVFLKSTDDSMIETLQKMSGIRHVVRANSKTITRDAQSFFEFNANESKVSIQMQTNEEAVLTYNDFAFIPERNSIVFRAGDSPIWNRNETILPMSWKLFNDDNTIRQPGKTYSLQTIPTLSSALEFDVRQNQPDFGKMLNKRMQQAFIADESIESYRDAYGYDDFDVEQMDPDNYSDDIMTLIDTILNPVDNEYDSEYDLTDEEYEIMMSLAGDLDYDSNYDDDDDYSDTGNNNPVESHSDEVLNKDFYATSSVNDEQLQATDEWAKKYEEGNEPIYASGLLSKFDLYGPTGVNHAFDNDIISIFKDIRGAFEQDTKYFKVKDGSLYGLDGRLYIISRLSDVEAKTVIDATKSEEFTTYNDGEELTADDFKSDYQVTDDFYKFLITFSGPWPFANGEFERAFTRLLSDE